MILLSIFTLVLEYPLTSWRRNEPVCFVLLPQVATDQGCPSSSRLTMPPRRIGARGGKIVYNAGDYVEVSFLSRLFLICLTSWHLGDLVIHDK